MAWLLYALMFGPTARVAIEDAYSGAVRVVDNVPLGPAAVGSLMSNVGYGVSRLFEQAFATPAMTDTGFADPLQALMSVRKGTLSRIALGSANSPTPGADIERSFINYVADCTLYDVDIGNRSIDDILRDPSWDTSDYRRRLQPFDSNIRRGGGIWHTRMSQTHVPEGSSPSPGTSSIRRWWNWSTRQLERLVGCKALAGSNPALRTIAADFA